MEAEATVAKVERIKLLHPVITHEQALLIHQAVLARNLDPEPLSENEDEEARLRREMADLTTFFSHAVEAPEDFPLRSREDNKRLLRSVKPVRGPAKQPSGRNKRKARQERRMGAAKRRRKENRELREAYNEAVQKMEAERLEAQDDYQTEIERRKARFESIAMKEKVSNDELQEVLELFGAPPEAIERIRELRDADTAESRLDRAAAVGASVREGGA